MELESLKYLWHTQGGVGAGEPDSPAVLAMLQKKSRGPVARMRKNLLGEIILVLVTYIPAVLFYLIDFGGRLSGISWLLLFLMVFLAGYYYRKNKLLKEMQCATCRIKPNLELQVRVLRKYIRFYLLAGTVMVPVTAILSYLIIHWKLNPPPGADLYYRMSHPLWWKNPVYWLALLAPFTIGIYYLNAWYVNKLYGRHIRKLEELLREMNDE
jgi:amino acid transporter